MKPFGLYCLSLASLALSTVPRTIKGVAGYLLTELPGAVAGSINGPELVRIVLATVATAGANTSLVAVLLAIKGDPAIFTGSAASALGTAILSALIFAYQRYHQGETHAEMFRASLAMAGAMPADQIRASEGGMRLMPCLGRCGTACPTPDTCATPDAFLGDYGDDRRRVVLDLLSRGLLTFNEARRHLGFAPLSPEDRKASAEAEDFKAGKPVY